MEKEKNNILIVGSSASAQSLAKKLAKSQSLGKIFIAPGNGVISDQYENIDIRENDLTELLKFALEKEISLTIPISEKALKADIVSFFQSNGQNIFGPCEDAANIALNKANGKKFLYRIHAQTAKFGIFDKMQIAQDWLNGAKFPVSIKCSEYNNIDDRLVCPTMFLALEFLDNLFSKGETEVLIEEFPLGENFTIYYITDGYSAIPITSVRNYKFTQDGDGGIYTNGIGCYAPDYRISETVYSRVGNIVKNAISALEKRSVPYVGILGVDCTMTGEDKFFVNEFKPFFQDFDSSAILNLIEDDLIKIFMACIEGLFSDEYEKITTNNKNSISAVVSSRTYGKVIEGLENIEDIENLDFYRIKQTNDNKCLTQKGENFVLTRTASTLTRAKTNLYEDLSEIKFDTIKYRTDIAKG